MNDEIKEILIFIENKIYPKDSLLFEKWSFLKDYIINLQQENERLKENNQSYQEEMARTWKIVDDYKSRIEKADEYIDKQKKKMYKSRNKIALFILMKLGNILQNGSGIND